MSRKAPPSPLGRNKSRSGRRRRAQKPTSPGTRRRSGDYRELTADAERTDDSRSEPKPPGHDVEPRGVDKPHTASRTKYGKARHPYDRDRDHTIEDATEICREEVQAGADDYRRVVD